jgi:MFS family permease
MVVTAMGILAFSILAPALPDLAEALGVSDGAIGVVQGAVAIPGIFLAPYIGYLSDRLGRRRVVRVSLLIFATAGTAGFFAPDYWTLVGLRVVQGLGTSALLSLGVVIIGDQYQGNRRRWAMGLNMAALTATTTLAPILGGFLAEGGTFRPFLVFLLGYPVFFAARYLPEPREALNPAPPLQHLKGALGDLRRRGRLPDFLGVLPMSLITLGVYLGLGLTVTPLLLESRFGLTVSQRGLVQAIGAGASSMASLLSGRVGRRFSPAQVLTTAFVMLATGFVMIGAAPTLWLVGPGLAVLGLATGSIFPLLQDYSASVGPARFRGVLVGTWVSSNRMGQFVGPTTGTLVAGAVGNQGAYFYGAGVMAAMALVWAPVRHWFGERLG